MGVVSAEMAAQRGQLCGLAIDDAEVRLFREVEIAPLLDLRQFAFADDVRCPSDDSAGVRGLQRARQMNECVNK